MSKNKPKTVVRDAKTLKWELKQKRVVESINSILSEEGVMLQPFISFTEVGITPQLRLIEAPAKDKKDVETQEESK